MNEFESAIKTRKSRLLEYVKEPLEWMSEHAASVWNDPEQLDQVFLQCMHKDQHLLSCNNVYAFDKEGQQVSSVVSRDTVIPVETGRNLCSRPYFSSLDPGHVALSRSYKNSTTGHSCITATRAVKKDGELLGYVAADFVLLDLPVDQEATKDRRLWLQVKGDPSIRGTLFMQSRTHSSMDDALDDVITIVEELLTRHGVFHAKLHFSSSRCTLWLYEDPYRYRVHVLDELLNDALLAYPARPYPEDAVVAPEQVREVLQHFRQLRNVDETVYLRAASLNIINGMVALNFSCDGSHYIPCEEFLAHGEDFWIGEAGSTAGD